MKIQNPIHHSILGVLLFFIGAALSSCGGGSTRSTPATSMPTQISTDLP